MYLNNRLSPLGPRDAALIIWGSKAYYRIELPPLNEASRTVGASISVAFTLMFNTTFLRFQTSWI